MAGPLAATIKRRPRRARGHLDVMTRHRIGGWAFAPGGVEIDIWLGEKCVGRVRPALPRPDVAAAWPHSPGATHSGFTFDLPPASPQVLLEEIRVVARPLRPWLHPRRLMRANLAHQDLQPRLANPPPSNLYSPFPKAITDAIAACWPEDCADLISLAGQLRFLERLQQIIHTPEVNALPAFADYAHFVGMMLAHCGFVERHFPTTNPQARTGANDFHCKPNSIGELFAIIHQLYVLKSWGVAGDFAEFGCFKGYSSAMLSFACSWLDIRMHIFDSFAGLPQVTGSSYQAGQFTGHLEEVQENIRRFGALTAVEFHPGFFADSLRNYRPPMLMGMWMDVDLEASARDLLAVADRIDPRASLFSHECAPDIFTTNGIQARPNPDNPIPPLLDKFAQLGHSLTGHHIAGYTGAFWIQNQGIPVAHSAALQRIMHMFRYGEEYQ